jgi:DNA-binding HxlR family transcriptional regulator
MNDNCTVYRTASFIGKRWTLNMLLELYKGKNRKKRYSELKASLPGITPKILSLRLKELTKQGLVKKNVDSSAFPIKSEYSLTVSGREFIIVIKGMKAWALRWKYDNKLCEAHDCEKCLN